MTALLIWYGRAARRRPNGATVAPTARFSLDMAEEATELPRDTLEGVSSGTTGPLEHGNFWIERRRWA